MHQGHNYNLLSGGKLPFRLTSLLLKSRTPDQMHALSIILLCLKCARCADSMQNMPGKSHKSWAKRPPDFEAEQSVRASVTSNNNTSNRTSRTARLFATILSICCHHLNYTSRHRSRLTLVPVRLGRNTIATTSSRTIPDMAQNTIHPINIR